MIRLRQILWVPVFVSLLLLSSVATAADVFFDALEDLPVMAGLTENPAAAVTFETATGRIVEVEASGPVAASAVQQFYADILPQLGWTVVSDGIFERDRERLQLLVSDAGEGRVLAAFSLSPKSQ